MEHALLRSVKALASLLMITTMMSIIALDTFLPELSEPDSVRGGRMLEREFQVSSSDHAVEVSEVSSKKRTRSRKEAAKFSVFKENDAVVNAEVAKEVIIVPLETLDSYGKLVSSGTVPTITSAKSSASAKTTIRSSTSNLNGIFMNGFGHGRYHIKRFRRSNPETAKATQFESIYDPLIKAHTVRKFPYVLCQGWGLIVDPTKPPVIPPTRAPAVKEIQPTASPTAAPSVPPTERPLFTSVGYTEVPPLHKSAARNPYLNIHRMKYHGSLSDIRLYGKPKRLVHRPGFFTGEPPAIPETSAPTPLPTPRVFHRICQDGRVIEIDGTQGPTVLPTVAPTYSPVTQETRPPAIVGYYWGHGYGMEDNNNGPRWSFTKNEGTKVLFNHPNIEKTIYRGTFGPLRQQFKTRVDTLSPW